MALATWFIYKSCILVFHRYIRNNARNKQCRQIIKIKLNMIRATRKGQIGMLYVIGIKWEKQPNISLNCEK